MAFGQAALAGRLARRVAQEGGQPGQIGLALQRQLVRGLVVQHVLRELRRQLGQLFHHLRITRLRLGRQLGAGAHEVQVRALQQPQLLGRQRQRFALRMQRIDALRTARHA